MEINFNSSLGNLKKCPHSDENLDVEFTNCVVCGSYEFTLTATGVDYLHKTSIQEYSFVTCQKCNHLYLNNRPRIKEISRLYPSNYATYTKKFAKPNSLLSKLKNYVLMGRFRTFSKNLPNDIHLLDIGCGDANFLMAIRHELPDAQLSGLDWNFGPDIEKEAARLKINILLGSIETVNLPQNHFDVITMNQLIEHVWDVDLVLNHCYESLKLGGLLSIETPNPDGWDRIFFRSGAWGGYYWPRHLNLFTRPNLSKVVERAGFKVISTQNLLAPPCWIYSIQFSAQRLGASNIFQKIFPDNSIILLSLFAVVDIVAKLFGATTSNQKLIAVKIDK